MRFFLSVLVLATASAASVAAQEKTWAGKTIITKTIGIKISQTDDSGKQVYLATLHGSQYGVLADKDGWIKVKTSRGIAGWFAKADAIPLEDAVAFFTAHIKAKPNDALHFFLRATARDLQGDLDGAIQDLGEALRLDPDGAYYYNRGRLWGRKREYDKAIADFDEAIRFCEEMAHLKLSLGAKILFAASNKLKQDYDSSLAKLKKTTLDPGVYMALAMRGAAWHHKKDDEKAMADLNAAILLDPRASDAYYIRGTILSDMGKLDLAITDFSQAIRLDPDFLEAYICRGSAWCNKKDYAKATADYRAVRDRDPHNAMYLDSMAWMLATAADANVRDGKRAMELANEALRLNKRDPWAMETLAAVHAQAGNFEDAVRWQERALQNPELTLQDDAHHRLELYRNKKPYRND